MSTRVKHVIIVVATQAACLAVGLWMHHRYTLASATRTAHEHVCRELETGSGTLLSELSPLVDLLRENEGRSDRWERLAVWFGDHQPAAGRLVVVDAQWRSIFPRQSAVDGSAGGKAAELPLQWTPDPERRAGPVVRGQLRLAGEVHLAISYPLEGDLGYVVVYTPVTATMYAMSAAFESLPTIGFLTFLWITVLLGTTTYIVLSKLHEQIERERSRSVSDSLRKAKNLVRTRDAVIFGLAKLAESRDPETGEHLERISVYSTMLASELRRHPRYRAEVTPAFIRLIGISSALHDIGKVGVEDRILLKPGRHTPQERKEMQAHAAIGGECLREIEQRLGGSNFLQMAREIAFAHHENWDGNGYPNKLQGEQIPLASRIVALADIYDALSSKRVYKDAWSHEECVKLIRDESGKRLDPGLVEVWLSIESKFRHVSDQAAVDAETPKPVADRQVPEETDSKASSAVPIGCSA